MSVGHTWHVCVCVWESMYVHNTMMYYVNAYVCVVCLVCTCVCVHMMCRMHVCVSVCVSMCAHWNVSICVCVYEFLCV